MPCNFKVHSWETRHWLIRGGSCRFLSRPWGSGDTPQIPPPKTGGLFPASAYATCTSLKLHREVTAESVDEERASSWIATESRIPPKSLGRETLYSSK